jgi:AcrR family transcriptional regulator
MDVLKMTRKLNPVKRTAILNAARSIFLKHGYAAAKMSDIASEANVAHGTLYLYYKNKEELGSAIGEEVYLRLITELSSMVRKIEDPDGIIGLVDWVLEVAGQEHTIVAMVKEQTHSFKWKRDLQNHLVDLLAGSLRDLMTSGIIRKYDSTALASLIITSLHRTILSSKSEHAAKLKGCVVEFLQHVLFDDLTLIGIGIGGTGVSKSTPSIRSLGATHVF